MNQRWAGGLTTVMLLPLLLGCPPPKERTLPKPTISQVLDRHTPRLMSIPGVVGTAEGECAGKSCILVLVERVTPALRQAIPDELEGISVEIRETGRIEAH